MSISIELIPTLDPLLNRSEAISFFRDAIACESITGNEANFVGWLEQRMTALSLAPSVSAFAPGRPNIWGERKGMGGGPRLLFVGHTDTVHVRGWADHWRGTERENPFSGAVVDGAVWGRGSGDLKAGICASLLALDLLDRAGITLKGDVQFAFVGDEESGEPGSGRSAGIEDYVQRVQRDVVAEPDFAIYVEPTQLNVFPAQMGFFIAEITVTGRSAYFGVPEQGVDALKATHRVLSALWAHSDEQAAKGSHDLVGARFVLVTEIKGGGLIAVPGECSFSLIAKLLPHDDLGQAVADLDDVIRSAAGPDVTVSIDYPAGRDHRYGGTGTDIDKSHPAIAMLSSTMAAAMNDRGQIEGAPYWSEAPFLVDRLGCPAVYCAPGDISNCHTFEERVELSEFLNGIVAFAAFIAAYCGIASSN
ncbi:M20/M25/M40 family metallo-hydrolase [Mesorhizobium sp. RP14(2022)]|uniref:M20/M25/M40 family metallo-hydrolase n=1 Tax=Mesorhizobium liriopis TaxID=2953882 RepID=A0ABT1C381_9HYPH|nr:M20/M25/M40 family metallo-hydrolase [Mesorhizobium liriopis]MCO6049274.1 M20/M25/M40 family metallo-hydrolase [Mesorhizobium liriopis]